MSGYVLVDCAGLDLLKETKQTISGIYQRCAAALATGKPVWAENILWGTDPTSPVPVMLINLSGTITASFCTLRLDIDSDDGVTITNYID